MNNKTALKRWFRRLLSLNRRQAERQDADHLHAYYWEGGPSTMHDIRDISFSGIFLHTDENWRPGTLVTLTLQKTDSTENDSEYSIRIQGQVVRSDKDGAGLRFTLAEPASPPGDDRMKAHSTPTVSKKSLKQFLQRHAPKKDRTMDGG